MNIRAKLTLTFFTFVIVVLTATSLSIYFFSSNYRELDFYRRLKNRAMSTAKILTEVAEVNATLLRRIERNNPASLPNQYIIIFDNKNEELYSSNGTKAIPVDEALISSIRDEREVKFRYNNYEALGFIFSDKYDRFTVVAAATDVYGLDALNNLRNVLMVTFGVSALFILILGWIYAGRVLRPISKIVNEVASISEVNLNQRLDEGNKTDELSKLSRTFNSMLERLQSAFTSQKNFIANASHEIKTPITIMSAEIEVTLLQQREKENYLQVLKSVLSGLRGLNKLSTQLLLLAQTEHPEKKFTAIRIDDILWEIKDELTKANPHYHIEVVFPISLRHETLVMEGDYQLMKVALLNLVDNGCKYSDNHQVTINLSENIKLLSLEFVNKGKGIAPDDIEKIFAPFYRGRNSNREKGFGIGLSLVNRIIKLHNGNIRVESVPFAITRFIVTLPTGIHSI